MATKVEKNDFANYLSEAKSWESDKVRSLEKSKRLAWIIAICAGALTFLSIFALAMLSPLKTAVPYVIRVESVTGAVDVVSAITNAKTNYDEVMNKYNLQWYVRWRESYSKHLIGEYYKNVGIMSSPDEQMKYSQLISRKNPRSPLNIYGDTGSAVITIKSTSFIKDNIALVRYIKEDSNGVTHWATTIAFQYSGTPMSEENRAVNPLGFQVLEYRNDPDQQVSENASPSNITKPRSATGSPVAPAVPSIQ